MNEFEKGGPEDRDFRIVKPVEDLPPPEGYEDDESYTKRGGLVEGRVINDEQGREIFHSEKTYADDTKDTVTGHWQKFNLVFDDKNRPIEQRSQSLKPGQEKQSHTKHEYDDNTSIHKRTITEEAGKEKGKISVLETKPSVEIGEGRTRTVETTTINEQGDDKNQPEAGTIFIKTMYHDTDPQYSETHGWAGEIVTSNKGEKWVKSASGEKLPEWAQED